MNRLALLALLALAPACDNSTGTNGVDYTPLLTTLTDTVAVPGITLFTTDADALVPALTTLSTTPSAANLAAAQTAWRTVRASWRKIDSVTSFGPAADELLPETIDASPADGDGIDAVVTGTDALDAGYVAALGNKKKGFLGLEHLLFSTAGNDTALQSLTGDGAPSRRRALVVLMAQELQSLAHTLASAWTTYATDVKTSGHGSARYPIQKDAVTLYVGGTVSALEVVVGARLATPLGRKAGSSGTPDPSLDPTSSSDSAVADMNASLASVKAMWNAPGFSAYVTSTNILADANSYQDACIAKVAAIPAPFATALTSAAQPVQDAYAACKTWKLLWYSDLVHAIGSNPLILDGDGD
ncbi:MAG: imelysin family protein [Polyangia bacterium]